jgi:radical SAM protein with 4Fe4S-binding SPASM domain
MEVLMRFLNRAKLLTGYLFRRADLGDAQPVEYIVETTAKCNLYCPMCPRETHKQPKEDMSDEVFTRFVQETRRAGEHVMLIGLGEPFLDKKIFSRIEYCEQHGIATLLSTNGTFLDEATCDQILRSPLRHITLSMDGASKESYEFYRKGARFEKVRDNFVRLCRMKHERKAPIQIVVQMIRMEKTEPEVDEFRRFWSAVPGVDLIRVKADETDLMQPDAGHSPADWSHPCHYLWRGAMYVKHNGDVYPCCQSYMLDGAPVGHIGRQSMRDVFNGAPMRELRAKHAAGQAGDVPMCARCRTAIPHPLLVAGSLLLHGETVRKLLPVVERLVYFSSLPKRWLRPQQTQPPAAKRPDLVQIGRPD